MTIIKTRIPLSNDFMPPMLSGRVAEMYRIQRFLEPLKHNEPTAGSIFIVGSIGSGKTLVTQYTLANMPKEINFLYLAVSSTTKTRELLISLMRQFIPEYNATIKGVDSMLTDLSISMKGKTFLVILDEIEKAPIREIDPVLHALSRTTWASIILISKAWNAVEGIEQDTKSSLKLQNICFQPYSESDLTTILKQRASLALNPDTIEEEAISLIARYAAGSGDARLAIQTLRVACEEAEITNAEKVTLEHTNLAILTTEENSLERAIINLPQEHYIALDIIYNIGMLQPVIFKNATTKWIQTLESKGIMRTRWKFYTIIKDLRNHFFIESEKYGKGPGRGFSNVIVLSEEVKRIFQTSSNLHTRSLDVAKTVGGSITTTNTPKMKEPQKPLNEFTKLIQIPTPLN